MSPSQRLRCRLAAVGGVLLLAGLLPTAGNGKVVKGTPQNGYGQQNIDSTNANDLINSGAATPQEQAVEKAETVLDAATRKARQTFEQTPAWTAALKADDDARTAMDNDTADATAKLRADPAYTAALAAREKAESNLDALRASSTATNDDIVNGAEAAMTARSAVTAMKTRATAGSPAVAVDKPRLDAADKALADLRKQEMQAVADDPDVQAATKALADAKATATVESPTSQPTPATQPTHKRHSKAKAKSTPGE